MNPHSDAAGAFNAAAVAELSWLDSAGHPDALPAVPLWLSGRPALAFPYAYEELARTIASSPSAAVLLSDPRMTGSGWRPLAATGRPQLIDDRDGSVFTERLLEQELRKYPPARALADSPILRREHWWYLPRLLVLIDGPVMAPVRPRTERTDQVLSVATEDGLAVDTVRAHETAGSIRLTSLAGRAVPDGPAILLGHDFSQPDMERWTRWVTRGRVRDATLEVDERPGRTALEPPLGVWQRLRRQRQLEKGCRRALGA